MELQKISDLAARYQITSRTLRYYEEMGLLTSTRIGNLQYRYYDDAAVLRLEQIIILRKMELPLKSIRDFFATRDIRVLQAALRWKLKVLDEDLQAMEVLKIVIGEFLTLLTEKGLDPAGGLKLLREEAQVLETRITGIKNQQTTTEREEFDMAAEKISRLTDSDIRIIRLRPMQIAWYRAESSNPEMDAWNVMRKWVKAHRLDELFTTRYFGFNNPNPGSGNPVYGYEVWVTVANGAPAESLMPAGDADVIRIKQFEGGLYAVTPTFLPDIQQKWQRLGEWVREGGYVPGKHQWLEEHIVGSEASWNDNIQLDLYFPIKEK
jgi:DNA-binding transcriptional MerR regulator/DNA gyrase inhibitor GyrI